MSNWPTRGLRLIDAICSSSAGALGTLVAALLLALMAVLAGAAALPESVTSDEVAHIGAGVSYLQKLDLRMNAEHPSLPKVLAALPLVIRGVHADCTHPSWSFGVKFFSSVLGALGVRRMAAGEME